MLSELGEMQAAIKAGMPIMPAPYVGRHRMTHPRDQVLARFADRTLQLPEWWPTPRHGNNAAHYPA